jgi:hypothetical protein
MWLIEAGDGTDRLASCVAGVPRFVVALPEAEKAASAHVAASDAEAHKLGRKR